MTRSKKDALLEAVLDGATVAVAAEAVGVSRSTVWNERQRDRKFAQDLHDAQLWREEEELRLVESELLKVALDHGHRGQMTAIQVWLYNRASGRWADMRGGGPQRQQEPTQHEATAGIGAALGIEPADVVDALANLRRGRLKLVPVEEASSRPLPSADGQ